MSSETIRIVWIPASETIRIVWTIGGLPSISSTTCVVFQLFWLQIPKKFVWNAHSGCPVGVAVFVRPSATALGRDRITPCKWSYTQLIT